MKHLNVYEEYEYSDYDKKVMKLKELLSHITKVFTDLGFDYENYIDGHKYETEFQYNSGFVFYIGMKIDNFAINRINLEIKKTHTPRQQMIQNVPDYFKSIDGVEFKNYDGTYSYNFSIKIKDVGKIINQISVDDFNLKLKANQYNL